MIDGGVGKDDWRCVHPFKELDAGKKSNGEEKGGGEGGQVGVMRQQ